jgi:uncharacterized repeat protein (TIGR01451 family)
MRIVRLITLLGVIALALPASAAAANPNLRVTITDSPDPVAPNDFITYTIDVKNTGTAAAQNVALKATTPANTTFGAFSASGWTLSGPDNAGTITATKSSFAAGASSEFSMLVRVNPSAASGTVIKATTSVSSNPSDPFPRDNAASTTTTVQRPALTVSNADTPDPVAPGHDITYSVGLANTGKGDASTAVVTDAVPPGTTYVSSSAPAGWQINAPAVGGTGNVAFYESSMPKQSGVSFSITVHVDPATAEGTTVTDTATASTSSTEDDTADNSATATTLVSAKADLETTMTVTPPGAVDPDSDLTYQLTVTNHGDVDAQNVTLSDPLPAGTTFVSAAQTAGVAFFCNLPTPGATGTISCNRTTLAHNEFAVFTVVLHVDPGAAGKVIDNTATAASSTAELNPANDSATRSTPINGSSSPPPVGGAADLAIVKPAATTARAGHRKTIRVRVRNLGMLAATGAKLTVTAPSGVKLVGARGCKTKKQRTTCALGGLVAGGKTDVKLVVRPRHAGRFKLHAKVSSKGADSNPANNAAAIKLKAR